MLRRVPWTTLLLLVAVGPARADAPLLSRFGAGDGPRRTDDGVLHLLDAERTRGQSNAAAWEEPDARPVESFALRCRLRVLEGGDGGSIAFLDTGRFGRRGPAPFLPDVVAPNLAGTFAVGIDVHDPPNEEPFGPWGNVLGLPEREVSLHWDGRELVKRVAPVEFRGDWVGCEIAVEHVVGGALVTVRLGAEPVFDRHFVPGLLPYASRLAVFAGTRADATTELDVAAVRLERGEPAVPRRAPNHVEVFNHVLTDNARTSFEKEVELPPLEWSYGRVLLTLEIHDAGPDWDEWDRNGHLYVSDDEGEMRDIVPFITSYRTPCHWQVDVTHFRPWLAGKRRFRIEAGTTFYENRGYMMSVSLDFHHALPPAGPAEPEPESVVPLWHLTARHGPAENHFRDAFEPRTVEIPADAVRARIFTTTTGHSQVGEFTPSTRTLVYDGDAEGPSPAVPFENVLWKTDCYLNPNRPQYGTWKYPRAGWAPGDVVRPWIVDVSPYLHPGGTAVVRYEPQPYDFSRVEDPPDAAEVAKASHVVRSYLVLYRVARPFTPAPALRIANVGGNTNASRVGMQVGDYLAEYDGRELRSIDDLRAGIEAAESAGKTAIGVVYYRGAERREGEVGPGKLGVALDLR